MQTFSAQTRTAWWPMALGEAASWRPRWLAPLALALLPHFARRDDVVGERYSGCSWSDETERQMTGDILR